MKKREHKNSSLIQITLRGRPVDVRGEKRTGGWMRRGVLMLTGIMSIALTIELAVGGRYTAAQSISCGITEITFTTGGGFSGDASISGNGTRIVFESNRDLTGGNADGDVEFFLYDTQTNSLTQITDTTGLFAVEGSSISGDGMHVAFCSETNQTGGNADGNHELFQYDAQTNSLAQVTNTTGGAQATASISANGMRIVFLSNRDLTGNNADGNVEIFLYDTQTNSFTQVTNATAGITSSPVINGNGTHIAFSSTLDLTGNNADGNREIFLYHVQTNSFTQATNTVGGFNGSPSISGDGTRIAFESDGFPSGNPDGNREIFQYNAATGGIAQITNTSGDGNFTPSINSDGMRIAFRSTCNLTGGNPGGNSAIFLYDTQTQSFTQVTGANGGASNFSPSISSDGTRIAFRSEGYADIGNADGNTEVFLASCLTPPPPPPATSADLVISKSADLTTVHSGRNLTYTIAAASYGPDAASSVVMNDPLPTGSTFVSASSTKGSLVTPGVGAGGTLTCNAGNLSNGESFTVTMVVRVTARGGSTITNNATVSSATSDPNSANNSAALSTRVFGQRK